MLGACEVKEMPITEKDDVKPGPGLFTGEKGAFEINLPDDDEGLKEKQA